ncbi:TIGR03759 family integrating conjugative element protein [Legionella israelensis]|uniref:TIGR03759 family integrating conjugative element protein n=1 Tax=Legionella israelensis TaxID=454 RepID=UPI00117C46F2|nr:TIGR03759 family integrating conjugative element protein [Legionella israelensis]QDP72177.1 TIGR03759 family integrating conjugative element protein [Legionella israelensis]
MAKLAALTLGFIVSSTASANLSIPGIINPFIKSEDNALAKAGVTDIQDEVIDEKDFELSDTQKHEAKVWQLTEAEEKRYIQLMQSRSGVYYQGLRMSPIDILGLNARDDGEREHFAELAAIQEAQKVAQNIAWNNAFYQAYNKLFKDVPVVGDFDPSPYSPYAHQPIQLKSGERLYLFIKAEDAVKTILMQLVDAVSRTPNTQLNLLFIDMDSDAIQLWANRHQIPLALVNSQQITLHDGTQQYETLTVKKKHTPLLLLSNGKASQVVDMGRF